MSRFARNAKNLALCCARIGVVLRAERVSCVRKGCTGALLARRTQAIMWRRARGDQPNALLDGGVLMIALRATISFVVADAMAPSPQGEGPRCGTKA
jgi:hypothetical protein